MTTYKEACGLYPAALDGTINGSYDGESYWCVVAYNVTLVCSLQPTLAPCSCKVGARCMVMLDPNVIVWLEEPSHG